MATTISHAPAVAVVVAPSIPHAPARNDALDGLRALAVVAVMLFHVGTPLFRLGWLGVDLFFVLSGFLITTLLERELRRGDGVSLGKFWGRRFLRLMPAYWLYAAAMTAAMLVGPRANLTEHHGWTPGGYVASLWLYYVNYYPQGGIWTHQHMCIHLWSLAVEEQFYLLWPLAFVGVMRWRRAWVAPVGILAAMLAYRYTVGRHANMNTLLQTRGVGIVMGCAAAMMLYRMPALRRRISTGAVRWGAVAGSAGLILAFTALAYARKVDDGYLRFGPLPLICLAFTLLTANLWYGPQDALTRLLSLRPLAYLGQISYGLYLYHMAAQFLVWKVLLAGIEHWNPYVKFGVRTAAYLAISLALAAASYHLLERPFLRLKERLR